MCLFLKDHFRKDKIINRSHWLYSLIIIFVVDTSFLKSDIYQNLTFHYNSNRIGGEMDSVLASNVVDRGFEPWSGQIKDYKIGICCFSSKHASLKRKIKDGLAWNQDNVSKRGGMSTRGLLFQWASTIKIQLSVLVWYKADLIIIIISLKINLLSPWYS
jgi:hypothetical protein